MDRKPYVISGKVVIRDDRGRCLLLKRSMRSKGHPGQWDLPGGKLDPGEEFEAGLLREVREEASIEVVLTQMAGTAESESPTRKVIYLIMEAQHISGEVVISEEHDEYMWVDIRDLPSIDLADQFKAFALDYAARCVESGR